MLTGRIGYRVNWRGKLIVQVEVDQLAFPAGQARIFWKDATLNELLSVTGAMNVRNWTTPESEAPARFTKARG